MGVDYLARKAAKKKRRGEAEAVKPRRERKKKQARRLCRGVCYKDPSLTAQDLADDREEPQLQARSGELSRYAHLTFGVPSGAVNSVAAAAAAVAGVSAKRKHAHGSSTAAHDAEDTKDVAVAKRRKLSTAVNLLDVKTAKTEAPRQKRLPLAAISDELKQFPELVQRYMAGEGFSDPMPIQTRCWPVLLAGRDVEAISEPGSGKTLAYMLPAAVLLATKGHGGSTLPDGPLALILLPTRELAQQVASACRDLRKYCGLRTCCITGGIDKQQQVEALSKQPHLLVATPGRLLDHVQDGALKLAQVSYLVLDEADKMLGLGFQPQIEQLKQHLLPPAEQEGIAKKQKKMRRVQVALFTATMPESLQELAAAWLQQPEVIRVATSAACISSSITQVVQVCAEHKKSHKLIKHLEKITASAQGARVRPRVLIFTNRIKTCRFVHRLVQEAGYRATLLHGERGQEEREVAMLDFRSGKAQIMVATDVAARGLHIRGLPHVVNWDLATNMEQYIHRVGRTGRLATDGHAFSFFTREMARLAGAMVDLLQQHGQAVDPNLVKLAESYQIAKEKLGLLNDATGEELGEPQKEDVLRQLGMKTLQEKKKDRQQRQRKVARAAGASGSESEGEEDSSSDAHGAGRRVAQQAHQPPPDVEELPSFFASRKFAGGRPGYAFKKGSSGLGYYLDAVQQQQQQQKEGGKRHVAAAKQQQKDDLRQLKLKYTHKPIGGLPTQEKKGKQLQVPAPAPALMLPGKLKELKRQRQHLAAAGQLAGFSSSDDEGALPASPPPSKRHKPLPGRLRKKLAKQRAAHD